MSTPVARERIATFGAVMVVASIAAIVSYAHMQQLAAGAGESWRSYLLPLSVDGLVVAAGMVLVGRRRAGDPGGALAWSALAGGVLASVAANMADAGAGASATAVLTAGWPAVAFAVAFELLQQQRQTVTAAIAAPAPPVQAEQPRSPAPAVSASIDPPIIRPAAPLSPRPEQPLSPALTAAPPPSAVPSPASKPAVPASDLDRVRQLVKAGHGRAAIASELGVTPYQARQLIAAARQPTAVSA